jgi:hypothetical protein
VGHQGVDAAAAQVGGSAPGQPALDHLERTVRGNGPRAAGVVAAGARHRPAAAQLGLELTEAVDALEVLARDQRALEEAPGAEAVDDLALVSGELQVDVELDPGVRLAGEQVEALVERQRSPLAGVDQ